MRERETWDASVDPHFFARFRADEFTITATLDRDGRDLRVNIPVEHKQTARWLAKALLEWSGEDEACTRTWT